MDLGDIKLFQALNARMSWLTDRQRVLAQNVANADTPNYMAGSKKDDGLSRTQQARVESSPTGNSVVLEEEMMKVSETVADYELMSNLYRKSVGLLKLAIGKSRG